jgi:hypothetical protein
MLSWTDVEVVQERNKDWLARAEKERLLRQVKVVSKGPGLWQLISGRVTKLRSELRPKITPRSNVVVKHRP